MAAASSPPQALTSLLLACVSDVYSPSDMARATSAIGLIIATIPSGTAVKG